MSKFTVKQIKKMWTDFFSSHSHTQIQGSSLIPENSASVLFTTAGMQPLIPYLLGKPHPQGKRLFNIQRCLRTNDIDSVGDERHLTFFEMLGNWSLGDYFKKEAIKNSFEFLTSKKYLHLPLNRLAVTCFEGDETAPKDEESYNFWQAEGMPNGQIFFLNKDNNWWAVGDTGPCGPDTEMFYVTEKPACSKNCSPACSCGHYVEIGNNVFMQYVVNNVGEKPVLLKQKNVDTGMGLERIVCVLNGFDNVYQIDVLKGAIDLLSSFSKQQIEDNLENIRSYRIIADHLRASTFILGDENKVTPSNVGQGYVLRRLIRRAITHANKIQADINSLKKIISYYIDYYSDDTPILKQNKQFILTEFKNEVTKFNATLTSGLKEFNKAILSVSNNVLDGKIAFRLHDTFGFPVELTSELCKEKGIEIDKIGYEKAFEEHQNVSRANITQIFKGGLSGTSEQETKYHTCTHIILATLREMFGNDVFQRGSNITPERMRLDFNLDRKMTEDEKKYLEQKVNDRINGAFDVTVESMSVQKAKDSGAMGIFDEKYGSSVTVYTIGDFSKEICGGPHVKNTSELGHFTLIKEESSSAGIRRIKGVLSN